MLPVAETVEAVNFPPDASDKVPDLAVKLVKFKWPVAPVEVTLMALPALNARAVTPCVLLSTMSPGTLMAPRLINPVADMFRFCVEVALSSLMPPLALLTTRSPPEAERLVPARSF